MLSGKVTSLSATSPPKAVPPIFLTLSGNSTDASLLHSRNAEDPISVIVSGNAIDSSSLHPAKRLSGIFVVPASNTISFKPPIPTNGACIVSPIGKYALAVCNVAGIVSAVILLSFWNTLYPISTKFFGRSTFTRFSQFRNA